MMSSSRDPPGILTSGQLGNGVNDDAIDRRLTIGQLLIDLLSEVQTTGIGFCIDVYI